MHIKKSSSYGKRFPLIFHEAVQSMHVLDHPSSSHSHVTTALKRTYSVDFELNIVFLLDSPGANKTKVWQQLPWPAI